MKECGGFSIRFKTHKDAVKAAELIKEYICSSDAETKYWAEYLQTSDHTVSVDTEYHIVWEDYEQLTEGIVSLLDETMRQSVIDGSFSYFNETVGNSDKKKLITAGGKLSVGEDMSVRDVYNNLSCLYDDPDQIRESLLKMGFDSEDIVSECGLHSKKDRQKGYRSLLKGVSNTAIKQVNEYYFDELDHTDDFEDDLEDMTPRKACVQILDRYWIEHVCEYDTFEDMLTEVYETCLDELDVELVSPDEFDEE